MSAGFGNMEIINDFSKTNSMKYRDGSPNRVGGGENGKEVETVTASDSFKISHKERGDINKQWLERSREGFCFLT